MSISSNDTVFGLKTDAIIVPPGATVAVLLDATTIPGANTTLLKYISGGTLFIIGVTYGVTLTGTQLVAACSTTGTGYLVGSSEALTLDGPVRCYLGSLSATTIVHRIHGKTDRT